MVNQKLISITRRNWSGLFFPTVFFSVIHYMILNEMISKVIEKDPAAPGILGFTIETVFLLLCLELIWNTLIEMEITHETITFRKPWKRLSLFFRSKTTNWTLQNTEWDEVYVFSTKSSYSLYFRKDQTAAFIASIEDGRKFIKDIEAFFHEKKVHWNSDKDFPRTLRRKLRKEYPERVIRG